jgi:hypothetical protein
VEGEILHFGRWSRVVNGRLQALPLDAACREALFNYKARIDDIWLDRFRGAVVAPERAASEAVTVGDLANEFLTAC